MIVMRTKVIVEGHKCELPGVIEAFEDLLKQYEILIVDDNTLTVKFFFQFRMKCEYGYGVDPDQGPDNFAVVFEIHPAEGSLPMQAFDIPFDNKKNMETVGMMLDDLANGRTTLSVEEIATYGQL